ncbi:hypothetical protein BU24DRAFT_426190 [Aaosphaeria arxii CBS 175.79]|uniref:Uncharacterized protein n=1 Tax=Aaosphaeria arxii CBS 175.79 TaxID=1450172 RepID=A0A6A5XHN2_9PLEO|nr:uncharacterized protein BU24DRAFT_426190 [Aaosphaeria arxii CBS 175.79]KAF2012321.1 hypothetical protein BU24DRAFT_426190 [Aaosphaeria arxii CBS 175.79]
MFNFSGSLLAGQHDLQKERQPPSRPVPVIFPSLNPPQPSQDTPPAQWTDGARPPISAHILSLKKPSDVTLETLALFNIAFEPHCDFETLVPSPTDNKDQHLPPKSWLDVPSESELGKDATSGAPIKLLSNGRRFPDRNEFYTRAKELFLKNEDAFLSLTRKSSAPKVPVRIAHFRKFWEGLDNLAYYWDNSLDEYLPPKPASPTETIETPTTPTATLPEGPTEENGSKGDPESSPLSSNNGEPRKKVKTEADSTSLATPPTIRSGFGTSKPQIAISSSKVLPARAAPPKVPWAMNMPGLSERTADLSKGSYKGYRIGNGAEMPDQYRLDCVRSFLEPIAWAFGVTLAPHRRPPVLTVEHVRFPVRMNSVGWRGPTDRLKARQGWMEGPVLGVQCRPDVDFGSKRDLEADSILDAVREIGGLLLLAQERAREGQVEKRAGEGKWWTTSPRWGGGPGGEVGEATGASDAPSQDAAQTPDKPATRLREGLGKERRRPSPAEVWKILRPGHPMWDPKLQYEAIGKEKDTEWDDIFMVSSLNHHISILKLRVHRQYIRFITDGTLPSDTPQDPNWHVPVLQRTRWYDLFSVEDRTEAMRGVWGVMAYLMRPKQQDSADQAADVAMKETPRS